MRNLIISAMFSLFLLFPMTAWGVGSMILDGDTTTSTTGFDVSKNVTITYAVDITAPATVGVGFALISSHLSGDTLYGAGSDTTQLFRTKAGKTKGEVYSTVPTDTNSTVAFSGWEKM